MDNPQDRSEECGNCIHWFHRNGPMGVCSERNMPKVSSQWCGRWEFYSPNPEVARQENSNGH